MFRKKINSGKTKVIAAVMLLGPHCAWSAQYPDKPVTVVVGYSAGGPTDTLFRIIGEGLAKKWNQPVIIQNKPGATSTIAIGYAAKSKPDGYTLVALANDFVASRFIFDQLPYNPDKDLEPIGMVAYTPNVLVVPPGSKYSDYDDFIADVKTKPGKYSYSTTGVGSTSHLAVGSYINRTGINVAHIPYKGFADSLSDLVSGRIDFAIPSLSSVMTHLKSGKLKALAVASEKRSNLIPSVPTFAEKGIANFSIQTWYALAAPSGTSPDMLEKINNDLNEVLGNNAVIEKIHAQGADIKLLTIDQTKQVIRDDVGVARETVKTLDLKR
ncbi:Bug family tripartite tricarboxylate transporter substrate binding protein [Advenella incenata]